jgi:ArsR family transcriptional regulator
MDDIEGLAAIYKALSDPTRLRLIKLLGDHEGILCVKALAKHLKVSQPAVSQHLRVLRSIQLVESNRQGPAVHYSINKKKITQFKALRRDLLGDEF